MTDAYFTTKDGTWFQPTGFTRGPWDAAGCHAGPPVGLIVRALENLETDHRLARITVEISRPIPMGGFRVEAEVKRKARSVTSTRASIRDDDKVYATAQAIHLRTVEDFETTTPAGNAPVFAESFPGVFPVTDTVHGLTAFPDSLEVRYDPEGSAGKGGPTTLWMRALPLLADEEPSGFQRICPLSDSGNGISFNEYLDKKLFINTDLTIALHREPVGEWFCSRSVSHWQNDATGLSDAELFDTSGPVGRALQTLLLLPA